MSNRTISKSKRRKRGGFHGTRKPVQREHKDRLFRLIFQDEEDLLELYNAVNGTDYQNTADLEITTIEDVIYLSMKNDLSFMFGVTMNLYEHQSTWNENMPLRGFFYFSELYQRYLNRQNIKLTDEKKPVMVPFPKYVVFYNGTANMPDRVEMKLSDCFLKPDREEGEPCLECKATVLNINAGRNNEMMRKCRRLSDYAEFIAQIRWKMDEGWSLEEATEISIKQCIDRGILADILTKHGTEVCRMILTEYDEQEEREYQRAEGRAEGRELGLAEGIERGLAEGIEKGIERGVNLSRLTQIQKKYAKGKSLDQMAEELEEEKEKLRPLYELAVKYPDRTAEELLELLEK